MIIRGIDYLDDGCPLAQQQRENLYRQKYTGAGAAPQVDQKPLAVLDVAESNAEYVKRVRHYCKGNALRDAEKAKRLGYSVAQFHWPTWIPDVVEINHSKAVRCGGPMRGAYNDSVAQRGGFPEAYHNAPGVACNYHNRISWGVFLPCEGHRLGPNVAVDRQLVAYVSFLRIGDVALYSQILGHGDHLHAGIMWLAHFHIRAWLESGEVGSAGLKTLVYGGWGQGGRGLELWKKKALFVPALCLEGHDHVAQTHAVRLSEVAGTVPGASVLHPLGVHRCRGAVQ